MSKNFKGERYIYFLMAYKLAKENNGYVAIGKDNGYVDGYQYERRFKIQNYDGKILLIEYKSSKSCADFSRVVEINNFNSIRPYINENGEDCFKRWTH